MPKMYGLFQFKKFDMVRVNAAANLRSMFRVVVTQFFTACHMNTNKDFTQLLYILISLNKVTRGRL